MTPKDYLMQARRLDERIENKIKQLDKLNDLSTKITYTLSDMPKNPNRTQTSFENTVIKIIDLQNEINKDIDQLVDLKKEINEVIHSASKIEQQILLEKRYLCFETWEQIAVDMNYSIQHVHRLHSKALNEIIIPFKSRDDM